MADTNTNDRLHELIERAFESLERILREKGIEDCEALDAAQTARSDMQLWKKLDDMVKSGDICGAENYLFDALEENSTPMRLKIARMFYQALSALTDERLTECSFSRREILDGMWAAEHLFMSGEDAVG